MEKIEAIKLLHELRTSGYLTNEEFEQKISEVLGKKGLPSTFLGMPSPIAKHKYHKRHENKSKKWTPEEDRFILSHANESKSWTAKKLGRTKFAVYTRLSMLKGAGNQIAAAKVKKSGTWTAWTAQEDEFIIKYRDKLNYRKIGEMLHRTEGAVKTRIRDLKMKKKMEGGRKMRKQTLELDGYILANYGQMTAKKIAENLNVGDWKVRNRIAVLQKEGKISKKYGKREDDGTVQVGENRYPRKYSQMG